MVVQLCNVIKATELYTKMIKMVEFYVIFFKHIFVKVGEEKRV